MSETSSNAIPAYLPLRNDLIGEEPYGAPQLDVPVCLNVNENPYAPEPAVVETIAQRVKEIALTLNRYPDREHIALRQAFCDYLERESGVKLEVDQLWGANGSNEIMLQLFQAFGGPGRIALGCDPTYSMYPEYARDTFTTWKLAHRNEDFSQYGRPEISTTALGKRLVQRHGRISEATDAALVPQRLLQRLTEHDGDVFDGMVRVDVGVTRGLDGQVNQRMLAERRHHMVVERHRRVDVSFAGAVEIQAQFDLGFAGFTNDGCGTRHVATPFGKCSVLLCWFSPVCAQSCSTIRNTSTKASRKRAISSSVPMHTRIQPSGRRCG